MLWSYVTMQLLNLKTDSKTLYFSLLQLQKSHELHFLQRHLKIDGSIFRPTGSIQLLLLIIFFFGGRGCYAEGRRTCKEVAKSLEGI